MNTQKRMIYSGVLLTAGVALGVLGACGVLSDFFCGVGVGLGVVALLRIAQMWRYRRDAAYSARMDVRNGDTRELYIAEKARSLAFFITVFGTAVAVIVFGVLGKEEMCNLCGLLLAAAMGVYSVIYVVLKKKY